MTGSWGSFGCDEEEEEEDEEGGHRETDQRGGLRIRRPQGRGHGFSDHSQHAHLSWY